MRVFKKHNVERRVESDAKVEKLLLAGFEEISAITDARENSADEGRKNLSKMKIDELKMLADEMQIEGADSLNKAELIAVLKEAMAND